MCKKLCFTLILCFIVGFLSADEWQVCLGSFRDKNNAETRLQILADGGIPSTIVEHKTENGDIFYRVFYEETFQNQEAADLHKKLLSHYPLIKDLNINDVWFLKIHDAEVTTPETLTEVEPPTPSPQRSIVVRDSDSGEAIPEADVNIDDTWQMKSDMEGIVYIPDEVQDGNHKISVSKDGQYVTTEGEFTLEEGKVISTPQISLPKAVDYQRIKIVLDWGEYPSDLDTHVFSNDTHIYFSNKIAGNMELDRDDTSSYGPETLTIKEPSETDTYRYFVHNYSDRENDFSSRLSNSEAQVKVYIDNEFQTSFIIEPNQVGTIWYVFDIVNGKEIVPKNIVSSILPEE